MTVLTKASASLIEYQGKDIYHLDYSNKKTVYDLIDAIEQCNMFCEIHIENYGKKDILMLIDLSDSFVFGKAEERLEQSIKKVSHITKKRAIVGLNRSRMIFLNMMNSLFGKEVRAFDNISDAKIWLAG